MHNIIGGRILISKKLDYWIFKVYMEQMFLNCRNAIWNLCLYAGFCGYDKGENKKIISRVKKENIVHIGH